MTLSVWRNSHLALAVLSSVVLIIASVTGVVLAVDAVAEKLKPYQADNFDELTLVEVLPELQKHYPEIISLSVDYNDFVILEAFDDEGNQIHSYINPNTGERLGKVIPKSDFIQWNIALHRSLFLKETGRFIVGLVSFLFFLIAVSGTVLVIKRQSGIRNFFSKINKDFSAQYFHIISGRLMLIPILLIALTATYLFLVRFEIIPQNEFVTADFEENTELSEIKLKDFSVFKEIRLSDVQQIQFPFMDDPDEYYTLKLNDKELVVNQFTGEIISKTQYPMTVVWEKFNLDLHTGRTHIFWAVLFGIACLNILYFIYSGFVITLKRNRKAVRNKFKIEESEYVILVGSENGSTFSSANKIHKQLITNNKKSFITELNNYTYLSNVKHLLVFTSTYGLGEAPSNAKKFEKLLEKTVQQNSVSYSVVGFGSHSYDDFCEYAKKVDILLSQKDRFHRALELHTVNDRSVDDFVKWTEKWSKLNGLDIATTPASYATKLPKLKKLKVTDRAEFTSDEVTTFRLNFKPCSSQKFTSGDLLAIYPENNSKERLYSIGKVNGTVQLIVRLHPKGLGSKFLYGLQKGEEIKARIISNPHFRFPKKASKITLIANGTGTAPFLGMLEENQSQIETHLYCGFRKESGLTTEYKQVTDRLIQSKKLNSLHLTYSRQEPFQYLMDLIVRDKDFFLDLLINNGIIMICGSLAMQKDVEKILSSICEEHGKSLEDFMSNNQLLTDCY